MSEWKQIGIAVLELYVALGVVLIGFGYMVMGKDGGRRAAQFYFGGSWRWTLVRMRTLVAIVVRALWSVIVRVIARPLLHGLRSSGRRIMSLGRARSHPRRR